jgi:ribonuclease H2 subunit A
VRVISAAEISDKMQRQTSNLNEISRDAAIQMIREVQARGVNVTKVFVDTVGDPRWYQTFLTKQFNGTIQFRVEKKADSLFKVSGSLQWNRGVTPLTCHVNAPQVVSAASIAAKVTRDQVISDWAWEGKVLSLPTDFGSGYPSDPRYVAMVS